MITIRVPATTANLGPGFDVFGLALKLSLTVKVKETSGPLSITYRGRGAGRVPLDERNLIWRAYRWVTEREGKRGPHLVVEIENEIPLARGLGSSGAAIVAGVMIANAVCRLGLSDEQLLAHALALEPHPDNITAAFVGGFVACCVTDEGRALYAKLPVSPNIKAVIVVPDFELPTREARAVLPDQYSRDDIVFNLQRVALLAMALRHPHPDLIAEAMRDRLHQPYRRALIPGLEEILQLASMPGLLGVSLSGAGPSVLALAIDNFEQIGQNIQFQFSRHGIQSEVLILEIERRGAVIETEDEEMED